MAPRKRRVRTAPPSAHAASEAHATLSSRSPSSAHLRDAGDATNTTGPASASGAATGGATGGGGTTSASPSGSQSTAAGGSSGSPAAGPDVDPADFCKLAASHAPKALRDARDAAASLDGATFSVASVALALFDGLVDWAVRDAAVQYKASGARHAAERRRVRQLGSRRATAAAATGDPPGMGAGTGAGDGDGEDDMSFGAMLVYSDKNVTVVCSICTSNISASRYAQHVEKCMGRGGRMSSRAATARLRASVERADKDGGDHDAPPVARRRRHSAVTADDGAGGADAPPVSHKRRKMSPVPAAGGSHGAYHARGLPPSGRTRGSPR